MNDCGCYTIAASSACEMVLVIPTPLGLTLCNTFKQGWYTPDPVSCPFPCFLRLPFYRLGHAGGTAPALTPVLFTAAPSLMLSPSLLPLLLTFRLLLSTASFSQTIPAGLFQLGLVGGLNVPALGSHVWATPLDI